MTTKRIVLIDPDGTGQSYIGVIVQYPTGVVYEQQSACVQTDLRSVEGYFVPLGGARYKSDDGRTSIEELRAIFHGATPSTALSLAYSTYERSRDLSEGAIADLQTVVESIAVWKRGVATEQDARMRLRLDDARLSEVAEAWVPVLTPDGPGILTWPNCD